MTTLKALKSIPNNPKYTVFGYIQRMEKELCVVSLPTIISYLILGYYFHGEYFEKAGDDLKISNDKMSVIRINKPSPIFTAFMNTAYGKSWIPGNLNKIIQWRFKIESYGDANRTQSTVYVNKISIGIVSKDHRLNQDFGNMSDKPWKYFFIYGRRWDFRNGLLVTMIEYDLVFDTINWRLSIEKGDGVIVYKDLNSFPRDDTRYKLAISMTSKDAKLTLIDFDIARQ